tara:strand:+ start:140 stop:721 length:582 start_codon:yes stop_codon:yes gene_type:complete
MHEPIDNPYSVFKPEMSYAEARRVITDAAPSALDGLNETITDAMKRGKAGLGEFNALYAGIRTTSVSPRAIFLFKDDHLKFISLDYVFLPHETPPGRSENECAAIFRRVVSQMTDAFGSPTSSTIKPDDTQGKEETVTWETTTLTATTYMFIDATRYLEVAEPRCGVINSKIFFGSKSDQKAFEAEVSAQTKQ